MKNNDSKIDRLRAAAGAEEKPLVEAPFGFDTRVVARWRSGPKSGPAWRTDDFGVSRLLRRVALIAIIITIVAAAGAYREASEDRETNEPLGNEFLIADAA